MPETEPHFNPGQVEFSSSTAYVFPNCSKIFMKRIALIDHEQDTITLLWHLVRKIKGYDAANFINSELALNWCQHNDVDLVVLNYLMPEMSFTEFIDQFQKKVKQANIPIILAIPNDQVELKHKAIEAGVTDFINKPIDAIEFTTRAKNLLTLKQQSKKLSDHSKWLNEEIIKATEEIRSREQEIIFRLTKAAEYRDPETGGHIKRMAHFSRHIAMELGMPADEQNIILEAAPMHDIGKVGIPDSILLKPGKLDISEFEIMKEHAQYGFDILNESNSRLMQVGAQIALAHHEKYDGSGYPNGLKDEEISIYGRIVAVADVFDALTSERPYKKAWAIEDAFNFLRENSGSHFDRACVFAFLHDIEEILRIKDRFKDSE